MTSPSQTQSTTIRPTTSDQSPDVAADQPPDIVIDQSAGRTDQTSDQFPDVDVTADHSSDCSSDHSSKIATDQSANVATNGRIDQTSDQSPDIAADHSSSIATDQSAIVATNGWTDNSNVESPVPSISRTNTSTIRPTTVTNNLLLQALSSNAESLLFPSPMTTASPESSKAVQQRRILEILDSAIALIDAPVFDSIESSKTHQQLPQ
jgi:hypothetical protein